MRLAQFFDTALSDLLGGTKDVCVVLLEAAHAGQPGQGAGELVAVQHAKVGHTERQLTVRPGARVEHDTMARAVHRLERKGRALDLEAEHVLLRVRPLCEIATAVWLDESLTR